jgi:hypothetical protein
MSRKRDEREARALRLLRLHPLTALELGGAAVRGEPRASKITRAGREAIGLSIGTDLVRRGVARASRSNLFSAT